MVEKMVDSDCRAVLYIIWTMLSNLAFHERTRAVQLEGG